MKMRTITCFGDQTSGNFLITPSVSLAKITRSDNFVIVNVFNSVTSSRVTGNRNFARKEELIYRPLEKRERTGKEYSCFPFV